ncbi:MAG: ribokinase [Chloroflexi bacterium]|nr:ribokinase [Chloroflexota bacterium]
MTAKITVIGSLNMDLVTRAAKIPAPGETVIGGDLHTLPGGKGANQAVAAARLGAEVSMVGRVGHDLFAQQLLENLTAVHVDHTHVTQDPQAASGIALIVIDDAGENVIVVAPGANGRLSAADVDAAEAAIQAADAVLLQLEIPLTAVLRAAQLAHKHGVKVILNPAPAQPLPDELLALVDILIPNETETAQLTGMPAHTPAEIEAAAAKLRQSGVGTIIMTLGERGALLTNEAGTIHFPPYVPQKVVDTTAAGDAFVGGLATALAEGKSLAEAVPWGNATGSLAVTRMGAQPSLPTRAEVEALLART